MDNYIRVDEQNIDTEHICCALSGNEANTKKEWMKKQFTFGYTFIKLNERAKVFIEYAPCEHALIPIEADNYMYVYCLWVSGKYTKQGHASALLALMEEDAHVQNKDGVIFLSSKKKRPFVSEAKYLIKKGYVVEDEGYEDYTLLCKHFNTPKKVHFSASVHEKKENGFLLYYSDQCVFTSKYVALLAQCAKENNIDVTLVKIENAKQAKACGVLSNMFSLFHNSQLITNEIVTPTKFLKIVSAYENT